MYMKEYMADKQEQQEIIENVPELENPIISMAQQTNDRYVGVVKKLIDLQNSKPVITKQDIQNIIDVEIDYMKNELVPGYSVEKKALIKVIEELIEEGKEIYILDRKGTDIRDLKKKELSNAVFLIGDQDGLPKAELKKLKKIGVKKISVGKQMYFASQTMTLIQNELDRNEI